MFGQWELLHIDFWVLSNVIFWPLIASWLEYMITLQLLLGCNVVYGGTSQISLQKLWRTWEISTLWGIIRWQVSRGIVPWVFSEFQLGIQKKRKHNFYLKILQPSGVSFRIWWHDADVRNVHLGKAKTINVTSLWPHISSVTRVRSKIDW